MLGKPTILNSAADYQNAVDYYKVHKSEKAVMIKKLENLRDNIYILVLKESSKGKDPEEQTADDFEKVLNPNPLKKKLGISDAQINTWIEEL